MLTCSLSFSASHPRTQIFPLFLRYVLRQPARKALTTHPPLLLVSRAALISRADAGMAMAQRAEEEKLDFSAFVLTGPALKVTSPLCSARVRKDLSGIKPERGFERVCRSTLERTMP